MTDKRIQEIILDTNKSNIEWKLYEPEYGYNNMPGSMVLGQFWVDMGERFLEECFVAEITEGNIYVVMAITRIVPDGDQGRTKPEYSYRIFLETYDDIVEITKRVMQAEVLWYAIVGKLNKHIDVECYRVGSVLVENVDDSLEQSHYYFFDRDSEVYDVVFSDEQERDRRKLLSWKEVIGEKSVYYFLSSDGERYEMS